MRISPGLGARAVFGVVVGLALFLAIGYGMSGVIALTGVELSVSTRQIVFKALMAAVAVGLWLAMGRRLPAMGWRMPRDVRWARVVGAYMVAALSMGAASIAMVLSGHKHPLVAQMSFLDIVIGVWIVSSVAEEIFVRGLVQSWIAEGAASATGSAGGLPGDRGVIVLASAATFASMHVPLMWKGGGVVGGGIIVAATFGLGWAAARVRQSTGSLLHAIGVHAFGNVAAVPFGIAAVVIYRLATGHLPPGVGQ